MLTRPAMLKTNLWSEGACGQEQRHPVEVKVLAGEMWVQPAGLPEDHRDWLAWFSVEPDGSLVLEVTRRTPKDVNADVQDITECHETTRIPLMNTRRCRALEQARMRKNVDE